MKDNSANLLCTSVTGYSMAPFMLPGDITIIEYTTADKITIGDIVIYVNPKSPSYFIAHRAVNNTESSITIKGDGISTSTDVSKKEIIFGRVNSIYRRGSRYDMTSICQNNINRIIAWISFRTPQLLIILNRLSIKLSNLEQLIQDTFYKHSKANQLF